MKTSFDEFDCVFFFCTGRVYQDAPDWITLVAIDLIALTNNVYEYASCEEACMRDMSTVA